MNAGFFSAGPPVFDTTYTDLVACTGFFASSSAIMATLAVSMTPCVFACFLFCLAAIHFVSLMSEMALYESDLFPAC